MHHDPSKVGILVWLPEGESPTEAAFEPMGEAKAEPWYFAHEAVVCKSILAPIANKKPWIKYRDQIWNEAVIREKYDFLLQIMRGKLS